METIAWQDFERVELRVGRVRNAVEFLCVPDRPVPPGAKLL